MDIRFAHTRLEWTKGQAFHRASCPISLRQRERESGLWSHHWPRSAYSEKPIFECPFAGNPVYSETATVLFGTIRSFSCPVVIVPLKKVCAYSAFLGGVSLVTKQERNWLLQSLHFS